MNKEDVKVGLQVRAIDPEGFLVEVQRKIRGRVGVIVQLQMWSNYPIIEFPAVGRRKAYRWVALPHWVEVVE